MIAPKNLIDILSYRRPHGSRSEQYCIDKHIDTLPNVKIDDAGNRYVTVGGAPTMAWLSHTDTVHIMGGKQPLETKRGYVAIKNGMSDCLGGDDGVGVWLMVELVKRKVPGLYVWHRGEEMGCLGSQAWVTSLEGQGLMAGIKQAVCLDRRGYQDVICGINGAMIASDRYARWLCYALRDQGMFYAPNPGGLMADVEQWADNVPECVNLSVGYHAPHTGAETVDIVFAQRLLDALSGIRWTEAPITRTPTVEALDWEWWDRRGVDRSWDSLSRRQSWSQPSFQSRTRVKSAEPAAVTFRSRRLIHGAK